MFSVQIVYAGIVIVNSSLDNTTPFNSLCTLREAILAANAGLATADCPGVTAGSNTLELNSGLYTVTALAGGELPITSSIIIQEGAAQTATISGSGRIFNVQTANGNLTLNGLTVQFGSAASNGGCIQVGAGGGGSVTFNNGLLENCSTTANGGAIGSIGDTHSITISGSTITANSSGVSGGAIFQTGAWANLSITGTVFNSNVSGWLSSAQGGAIYFDGSGVNASFSITNSSFISNRAQAMAPNLNARGGAVYASFLNMSGTIGGSSFTSNQAVNGVNENRGGAIYKVGADTLTISGSVFTNNTATEGGAVFNNEGHLSVTSSRLQSNNAANGGGAYYSASSGTDVVTASCIVDNDDTAVIDVEVGNDMTATGNWWGSSWGPQIPALSVTTGSYLSTGDSISGDATVDPGAIADVLVGLTSPGTAEIQPTGDWETTVPTVAGATCLSCTYVSSIDRSVRVCSP